LAPGRSPVQRLLPPLLLLLITAVAYVNSDHPEFLFDSDQADLLAHPARHGWETWRDFWRDPVRPGQQLTYLTFALNHAVNRALDLDGLDVTGYLVLNVLLHGINACLLWLLIRSFLRQLEPDRWEHGSTKKALTRPTPEPVWVPALIAALFALHPVHTASVAYIMQRRSTMATTFYLAAVLLLLRARRPGGQTRILRLVAYALGILLCFWLACRSKEIALTLPLTLLLVEFCLRAPLRWSTRRYWMLVGGGVLLYVMLMLVGLYAIGRLDLRSLELSAYGEPITWGVWPHFLSMCLVVVEFWKRLLLPLPQWLCMDHPATIATSLLDQGAGLAMLLHLVLVGAAFVAVRRGYVLAGLGILWFYAVQVPYMILPQSEFFVEYKMYLPSVGLFLVLAEIVRRLHGRVSERRQVAVLAAIAAVLFVATVRRNVVFQNAYNFWSDVLAKNPHHYRPHSNLGAILFEMGRYEEAEAHLLTALRYRPGGSAALSNLGLLRVEQKRFEEAVQCFQLAIASWPEGPNAHYNLGNAWGELDKFELAEAEYRLAIKLDPDHELAYNNLAGLLVQAGRQEEALQCYLQALQLNPRHATICRNLINLLMKLGRLEEAVRWYARYLQLIPPDAALHNEYGAALFKAGRAPEAVQQFTRASELDAAFPQPRLNLGTVLLSQHKYSEAATAFEAALRLDPRHATAHNRLGYALEQLGRKDDAKQHYKQAAELAPDDPIACWNYAEMLREEGDSSAALELYRRVVNLQPDNLEAQQRVRSLQGTATSSSPA
jgi:tetratricopeptide (TPR) repeat protein